MRKRTRDLKELYQYILATIIVLGQIWLFKEVLTTVIPESNKSTFDMLVGSLITAFTLITGYFFGSSLGSKNKTDIMNEKEAEKTDNTPEN